MNPDKQVIVNQLAAKLNTSPYLLLVDYTGLTVPQFNEIRKRLRAKNGAFHVTKNSYVKAYGNEKQFPKELEADLKGQTAVVYGDSDVCAAAGVLKGFAKEFQRPTLKSGILDGQLLSAAEVSALGDIGSRENMLSTLLGVINAPASALARVINAHVEKESAPAEPAAEEAAPAEAAAEPAAAAAETPAAEAPPAAE